MDRQGEYLARNAVHVGDVRRLAAQLEPGSVQTIVTSPPFWGQRSYLPDDHPDKGGELGGEATPDEYAANLVAAFAAIRPALRDDGTLWLNLADGYHNFRSHLGGGMPGQTVHGWALHGKPGGANPRRGTHVPGLKEKDLIGIPWRVAFALQAAGWYLRADIIEEVELYCPCGCGHVMEERVWRYAPDRDIVWKKKNPMPERVLDRPTKAHEYLFLFSKKPTYFYDAAAIAEVVGSPPVAGGDPATRNRRSVWTIATRAFAGGAHFATFPPELVSPCLLAGTSAHGGCARCGAAWERETERTGHGAHRATGHRPAWAPTTRLTGRWRARCACDAPVGPQLVLDPFVGSGTTPEVASGLGRDWIGLDLDERAIDWTAGRLATRSGAR